MKQATSNASPSISLLAPVTPGEMLQEEFLDPLGLTPYRVAKDIGVPVTRIYDIVAGKRAVTAQTDLLLCRYFGLSEGWWLRLQAHHDIQIARRAFATQLNQVQRCPRMIELAERAVTSSKRRAKSLA